MKLLNHSIRLYLVYSIIIVLISIPAFYFVIQALVSEETDESLSVQKEAIIQKIKKLPAEIPLPEIIEPDILLSPSPAPIQHDRFYKILLFDKISKEHIPYRVLESGIMVGNHPYRIQLKHSLVDSEELIQSILIVMILLLILIASGFLIINRVISKQIWKPFYTTVSRLNNYEFDKNEKLAFEKTKIDEFRDLNNSISVLIKKNLSVFQSQKEFTENAAHEMQTPLAILQGKLELLMQTQPLNTEQAELISGMADASQRMNRFNRSLLLLTKIENNQFTEKEDISLRDLAKKMSDQFIYLAEQKNIHLGTNFGSEITVNANRSLLEILLSNLIINAVRHSPSYGLVIIETTTNGILTISNTAENGALDISRVFQRFQKDSKDQSSTGLGLAIAEKICALYQFSLQYDFIENMHVFSVKF